MLKFWFEGLVRIGELAVYPARRWAAIWRGPIWRDAARSKRRGR